MKCEDCLYAMKTNDGKALQCRRYPPAWIPTAIGTVVRFVETQADVWCGEFKPKPKPPATAKKNAA